jgi:hypothetical protein
MVTYREDSVKNAAEQRNVDTLANSIEWDGETQLNKGKWMVGGGGQGDGTEDWEDMNNMDEINLKYHNTYHR